jgi:hypothetical protein
LLILINRGDIGKCALSFYTNEGSTASQDWLATAAMFNPQLSTNNSQPFTALHENRIKREPKFGGIAGSNT